MQELQETIFLKLKLASKDLSKQWHQTLDVIEMGNALEYTACISATN